MVSTYRGGNTGEPEPVGRRPFEPLDFDTQRLDLIHQQQNEGQQFFLGQLIQGVGSRQFGHVEYNTQVSKKS